MFRTLITGNLDFEARLAAAAGPGRRRLPLAARRAASAFGSLLRAFADDGDILWTPEPLDPDRMTDVPGLPRPRLVTGPLRRQPRPDRVLAWGWDDEVAGLGPRPPVDPAVVRRANHRSFGHGLARDLGVALPGAAVLLSVHALEQHLAAGGADASPEEKWVLKPVFSAAGRNRVFGQGRIPSAVNERAAARILAEQGAFLFEPWMERIADFAATGHVGEDGPCDVRCHRQVTTPDGRWRGTVLADPGPHAGEIVRVATECGRALFAVGFRGRFGVDSATYRDRDGRERLNPLVEINARMTFGHVTRRLAERLAEPLAIPEDAPVGLFTGRAGGEGFRVVPLLTAGAHDGTTARFGWKSAETS